MDSFGYLHVVNLDGFNPTTKAIYRIIFSNYERSLNMATVINIHNFVINDVFREAGKYSTFGNPRKPRNEARLSGRSIKK